MDTIKFFNSLEEGKRFSERSLDIFEKISTINNPMIFDHDFVSDEDIEFLEKEIAEVFKIRPKVITINNLIYMISTLSSRPSDKFGFI